MKKIFMLLNIAISAILISGCSIKKGTINSYNEPTYQQGSIKRIAVLGIRNARFAPSESRQINKDIIQALQKKNPNIIIVPPSAALRKINDSGLAKDWAEFIEDYYTSGIPNKQILEKIAYKLKVDAIMQGQMVNVFQQDGNGWTQKGITRVTVSYSIIQVATAKPIWEATSDGIRGTRTESQPAPPIAEAVALAIEKIKGNIPNL